MGVGHALESETSQSLVMQPQNVKLNKAIKGRRELPLSQKFIGNIGKDQHRGVIYYPHTLLRGWEESGISGDPMMACKEEGEEIINAIVNDFSELILQIMDIGK